MRVCKVTWVIHFGMLRIGKLILTDLQFSLGPQLAIEPRLLSKCSAQVQLFCGTLEAATACWGSG